MGPAGLASIIGFASVEISLTRQIENQEKIVAASERLLEALATAIGFAGGVGKGQSRMRPTSSRSSAAA